MPSKNEVTQYRLLSDSALNKFKIFCAAGRYPKPDKLSQGAFDSLSPQLKRQMRQLTPSQKAELRLAMDVGENQGQQPDYDEKTIAKLLDSIEGSEDDGGPHSEFVGKLLKHLHKVFPGCCGELTDEARDAEGEEWWRDGAGAEDDDQNEPKEKPERLNFQSAGATRKLTPEQAERRRRMMEGERDPAAEDDAMSDVWESWKKGGGETPGTPKVGGSMVGMDSYSRMFPNAARIGTDNYPANMNGNKSSVPRSKLNALALDAKLAKRVDNYMDSADDYERCFPETRHIQVR